MIILNAVSDGVQLVPKGWTPPVAWYGMFSQWFAVRMREDLSCIKHLFNYIFANDYCSWDQHLHYRDLMWINATCWSQTFKEAYCFCCQILKAVSWHRAAQPQVGSPLKSRFPTSPALAVTRAVIVLDFLAFQIWGCRLRDSEFCPCLLPSPISHPLLTWLWALAGWHCQGVMFSKCPEVSPSSWGAIKDTMGEDQAAF